MSYTKRCPKCMAKVKIKNPENEDNIMRTHALKCGKGK